MSDVDCSLCVGFVVHIYVCVLSSSSAGCVEPLTATMTSKKKQDDDERFLRVQKDPRFWEMPERERKVKIDKRFQSMFHDKRFKVKYTVDKRGRPINHSSTEDLKRFYKLSDSEDEEDGEEDVKSRTQAEGKKKKAVKKEGGAATQPPARGVRVSEEGEPWFLFK